MAYRIIIRRDTTVNWEENNPVLLAGEPGYETDSYKIKIGDGQSKWLDLPYYAGATGATGSTGIGPTGSAGPTGPMLDLVNPLTYIQLTNLISESSLVPGVYYTITDYKTCYDRPDFDASGNKILDNTYVQGDVDPIMVFATSESTLAIEAQQISSPNDVISYDSAWNATEISGFPAYGRITERIDARGNRTDYDHKSIEFKRYKTYRYDLTFPEPGQILLQSNGTVIGTATTFSNYSIGSIIAVPSSNPVFYEVTSVVDNLTMTVTGVDIDPNTSPDNFYVATPLVHPDTNYISYKQNNIDGDTDYELVTTFFQTGPTPPGSYNNYINNYADVASAGEFILSNNVFYNEASNNVLGYASINNTSQSGFNGNRIGQMSENVILQSFLDNSIGIAFDGNLIDSIFQNNVIGNYAYGNSILNKEFISNSIGTEFTNNYVTPSTTFVISDNRIGNGASGNIIHINFTKNYIANTFSDNQINGTSGQFNSNQIFNEFRGNIIDPNFSKNTIQQDFTGSIVGDGFKYNEVKCDLISIDFSTATKVYESYDKTILTDSSGGLRLSYVSSVGPTLTFAGILS
jgi:hypothetical protein